VLKFVNLTCLCIIGIRFNFSLAIRANFTRVDFVFVNCEQFEQFALLELRECEMTDARTCECELTKLETDQNITLPLIGLFVKVKGKDLAVLGGKV